MAILFAGDLFSEMDVHQLGDGDEGSWSDPYRDPNYSGAVTRADNTSWGDLLLSPEETTIWMHHHMHTRTSPGTQDYAIFYAYDAADNVLAEVKTTNGIVELKVDGTVVATSDLYFCLEDNSQIVDVELTLDATTGRFAVYTDAVELVSFVGNTNPTAASGMARVRMQGCCTSYEHWISEILIANTDTRTMRCIAIEPTAAGSRNDWTGTEADIDDDVANTSNMITTNTSGDVALFSATPQLGTIPAGNQIDAVALNVHAARGTSGPTTLQPGLKAGTTEDWGAMATLSLGFEPFRSIWAQNPDTAAPWTESDIDALEIGVKAG